MLPHRCVFFVGLPYYIVMFIWSHVFLVQLGFYSKRYPRRKMLLWLENLNCLYCSNIYASYVSFLLFRSYHVYVCHAIFWVLILLIYCFNLNSLFLFCLDHCFFLLEFVTFSLRAIVRWVPRCLYHFPLVVHQVLDFLWKIISNPYQVFKHKYFWDSFFMDYLIRNNKSFSWRIILAAREVLQKGLRWKISAGLPLIFGKIYICLLKDLGLFHPRLMRHSYWCMNNWP